MSNNKSNSNRIDLRHDIIHLGEGLAVSFLRTLRIPDDGKTYPCRPGWAASPSAAWTTMPTGVPPNGASTGA